MSIKTKIISARVPVDIAEMIKKSCETNNVSVSKYLTEIVTNPGNVDKFQLGGIVDINKNTVPKEIEGILSAFGGLGVGMVVYKVLKAYMPRDKFDEDTIENFALLGSIACGLGSFIGIDKLLKDE
jgi:hypothetical protein